MDSPHPFIDSGHDWSKGTETTIDGAIQHVEEQLYSAPATRDLVACSAELPAVKGTGQSARPARIRPDQQVIQNREQILNEWSQVGPFLGIQGRASVCPSQNERAVTNPAGTCEEEEEILAEAQWNQAPINEVAKRVPGAEQLLEAGQEHTVNHETLVEDTAKKVVLHIWPDVVSRVQPKLEEHESQKQQQQLQQQQPQLQQQQPQLLQQQQLHQQQQQQRTHQLQQHLQPPQQVEQQQHVHFLMQASGSQSPGVRPEEEEAMLPGSVHDDASAHAAQLGLPTSAQAAQVENTSTSPIPAIEYPFPTSTQPGAQQRNRTPSPR